MDPLAEAPCFQCIDLSGWFEAFYLAWIVIIIIAREFIISGFRLIASDNGVVIAAGWWGKIKTTVQMVMSIMLIINLDHPLINLLEQVAIYLAVILTVISLIDYMVKNKNVLKEKH